MGVGQDKFLGCGRLRPALDERRGFRYNGACRMNCAKRTGVLMEAEAAQEPGEEI
ncbi:MAG TPA: hypothetical protein PKO09_14540 [Anaerolineae bacterium]|nr:hypothetical protein [Anaerolineae bacterium]